MAIDVRSLSITGAFNAIKSFFLSQENNSKWKDTETGAEGNFLMRMLANVIRVISQNTVTGRRENNLETANLMSSNIGIGVTTGSYPTFRGRNQRRQISFTPNANLTVPKFTRIGQYDDDHGIYTLEDLTFIKNEEHEPFMVVIGKLRDISWTANTTALKKFIRFEQGISEDVDLYIDTTSLSKVDALSKYVKDMIYDKYCILTNPHKSVTIQYCNNMPNAKYRYSADTVFTLRYIELEDVKSIDFTPEMFAEYGTLNSVLTIENYIPFEDIDSIKFNAPVHRETQALVRSKRDYADLVREFTPSIKQTTYKPLTPTYTAVSYMKNDKSLIEDTEVKELMVQLKPCTAFGRPLPDIVHPVEEVTTLDVTLGVTNNYINESDISADVQSIIDSNYANVLNGNFDKYELENLLNKISYVKYSRVDIHTEKREGYVVKKVGDFITAEDRTYKCEGILGTTGLNEPEWKTPGNNSTVEDIFTGSEYETIDNEIIWACYKRLDIKGIQSWVAGKKFMIGDYVYSESIPMYMFKAVDLVRYSYREEPDVVGVAVGDYIYDNNMILLCITYNASYPDRENSTQYRLGDKFNINGLSFEYVGMKGRTSSDEVLTFNDAKYDLLALTGDDYERAYAIDQQNCLYIEDEEVATIVNEGDILRINLVEVINKEWEEVSPEELTMGSKLDTEVKEYKDDDSNESEDDEAEEETEPIIDTDVEVTVVNYYTGNTVPDILDVDLGDSIYDGEFTITRVPYNEEYPERISAYSYNNNDHFTITVYKMEDGVEIVDYEKSFVVVAPTPETRTTTTTVGSTNNTSGSETSSTNDEVKNANWKELEEYLSLQDEIQEWISSEGADKLRCPKDVITFFREIGRITAEQQNMLENYYYQQYDEYDEHQIYMYMDSMNATRKQAIDTMKDTSVGEHCHQLKDPVSDANYVKQYDSNGNVVYYDKYSGEDWMTIEDIDETGHTITRTVLGFTVTRYDKNRVKRIERTFYYDSDTLIKQYGKDEPISDTETVSTTYNIAVAEHGVDAPSRVVNGVVKHVTRITPVSPIPRYLEGSTVDISFKKTNDGDIRWVQVEDTEKIEYDWNVYANYDVNLTVKY